jgi:hypothetical protein
VDGERHGGGGGVVFYVVVGSAVGRGDTGEITGAAPPPLLYFLLLLLHGLHDRGGALAELNHNTRDVPDDLGQVTRRDEVGLAGVDGHVGAVLVLDLHRAFLEVAAAKEQSFNL